jgi:hypothetical protein
VQAVKSGYSTGSTSQSINCGQKTSANVTMTATSGGAQIGASPGGIEFYYVTIGGNFTRNVIVTNTGTSTLTGTASTSAPFSIVGSASYSLAAGASKTIAVRFAPTADQRYEGVLSLTGAGTVGIPLGGRGFDPAEGMVGDVDSSGDINALDATLINLYLLFDKDAVALEAGLPPDIDGFNPAAANVNRDDEGVSGLDATLILLEQLAGRAWLDAQVATNGNARSHSGEPLD